MQEAYTVSQCRAIHLNLFVPKRITLLSLSQNTQMVWQEPRVYTHPALLKKKTAYAVQRCKPYQYCILCCCQFLTAILFYCNAAILFGTLQASYLICKEPTKHTKHSNKKDSHSNHHHHSFIAVQKLSETYLNIKCHYVIFLPTLIQVC